MTVVRRHIWLMATVAALFGLQASLCALACLDDPQPESTTAHHAEEPCHEHGSSSPVDRSSHEDRGCEFGYEALVPSPPVSVSAPVLAFVPSTPRWQPTHSSVRWAPPVPKDADLPPPDILLLKSTLLI